jgi:anti-sigma B factor antagonist
MPVSFSISDSSDGPRKLVIWVNGELDADTARAVRAKLSQADRDGRWNVVLDLAGVTSVDSSGLSAIVSGAKGLGESGQLSVISPPKPVSMMLDEAGLSSLFDLLPNRRSGDRRRRRVAVPFERRKGGDRRSSASADGGRAEDDVSRPITDAA